MKSLKFRTIDVERAGFRVIEVTIEAVNQFTGEVFEVKGYARCSSKDKFVGEKGKRIAGLRAVRKALKMMIRQHKAFIATPYINNPTELYYRQRLNELLTIYDELRDINDELMLLER